MKRTLWTFESYVEHGLTPNPWRQVRVWVFPEERLHQMQPYIESKLEDLEQFKYSTFKAGVVSKEYKDPPLVEVFICVANQRVPVSQTNRILGHELAHPLAGESKEPFAWGKGYEKLERPAGIPPKKFRKIKQLIDEHGLAPTGYVTKGLLRYLELVSPEGEVQHLQLSGEVLHDLITCVIGDKLSDETGDLRSTSIGKFISLVGERVVFDAYTSGDTRDLERIFHEKTGRSLHEFTIFLDENIPDAGRILHHPKKGQSWFGK